MNSTILNNVVKAFAIALFAIAVAQAVPTMVNAWAGGTDSGQGGCCGGGGSDSPSTPTDGGGGGTPPPETPVCNLNLSVSEVNNIGDSYRLTWSGTPAAASFFINGSTVADSGSVDFTFTGPNYDRFKMVGNNGGVTCEKEVRVIKKVVELPRCESFTASPNSLPFGGGSVALTWDTTNATNASIDGQTVAGDGSMNVNVTSSKTFTLNLSNSAGSASCTAPVTVAPPVPHLPACVITATPSSITNGGSSQLKWTTTNAVTATINQSIGSVNTGTDQTRSVSPTVTTTYTMTVTNAAGQTASCAAPVTVTTTNGSSPTCDIFTSNYTSVNRGTTVNLSWETTNATAVTIDNGVGSQAVDGNVNVSVSNDTTYTLTATDSSGQSVTCSRTITVSGGGGGGSSYPRCDLDSSKTRVNGIEEVTLDWKTTRGNELTIYEGSAKNGTKLYYTDEDDDVDEGSIKVVPKGDTTYTLVVERGSQDKTCTVKVTTDGRIIVTTVRDQQPLVGISLTRVPYTGFEAGPALTIIFYTLLALWGMFVAYSFAIKRDSILGFSLEGAFPRNKVVANLSTEAAVKTEEVSVAAEYVASAIDTVPANLPTGIAPVTGYAAALAMETEEEVDEQADQFADIENRAHAEHVLLSSDAMRYFVAGCPTEEQFETLDRVMKSAKGEFPTEDGWIVINLERMQTLLDMKSTPAAEAAVVGRTTVGIGSLAEAIVTGNMGAAYELIGRRPMIALADAAADLDAIYRKRQGNDATVSALLDAATTHLSAEQLHTAINALTTALDGMYTNEAEAVKMAILKAAKVLND